ncbi:MAG: FlgD immunoglobulin-like domain containing protein [Candidatus Cloacimonadaceae bacterium]|nr:hypothetical protein [Candidatus Cloacimonadota bacterium]MDY0127734.1 FlgD immunoglobulin-like domain containing protein [Candidatus Cloacimonadaceae bacterium]
MKKKTMIIAGMILLVALSLTAQKAENLLYFDISPNPMEKHCDISLEFRNETFITLTILNDAAEVVKTIYSGPVHKSQTFGWERDDAMGNIVPNGTYHVVINYQSRYTSTKKTLILK